MLVEVLASKEGMGRGAEQQEERMEDIYHVFLKFQISNHANALCIYFSKSFIKFVTMLLLFLLCLFVCFVFFGLRHMGS